MNCEELIFTSEKFLTRSGVLLFLFRTNGTVQELLLQQRYNTGYSDGMWDCAAVGHVEANESMKMAVIREAREELGINIDIKEINFATLTHKREPLTGNTYYNAYFVVTVYEGDPKIKEPEKCSCLKWFDVNELPIDFIAERKQALQNYINNISYDEFGWD